MTAPLLGTCEPWAVEADLCEPCEEPYILDAAILNSYLQTASDILYYLSGRQFPGECDEVIRPCTAGCRSGPFTNSVMLDGHWFAPTVVCGCRSASRCGCSNLEEIKLPHYPVISVDQVKIDGAVLAASKYRVDDYAYLVRTDGESWPSCQDLSLPSTADDTWEVSYTYGHAPPPAGIKAAAVLACELYMACQPEDIASEKCRLPRNVITVARQGVTVTSQVLSAFTPRYGRPIQTGIWEIDLFLVTYNPHGLTSPSILLSPDAPPTGRRVGT